MIQKLNSKPVMDIKHVTAKIMNRLLYNKKGKTYTLG